MMESDLPERERVQHDRGLRRLEGDRRMVLLEAGEALAVDWEPPLAVKLMRARRRSGAAVS